MKTRIPFSFLAALLGVAFAADGWFDFAANGGGVLTLRHEKGG